MENVFFLYILLNMVIHIYYSLVEIILSLVKQQIFILFIIVSKVKFSEC